MKKIKILLVFAIVISIFASCKTREKCPAYGKNAPVNSQQVRS